MAPSPSKVLNSAASMSSKYDSTTRDYPSASSSSRGLSRVTALPRPTAQEKWQQQPEAAAATSDQPDRTTPLPIAPAPRRPASSSSPAALRVLSLVQRRFSCGAMEEGGKRAAVRTVRVRNISDLATEREVREFFSFTGEIEHVDLRFDGVATGRTAYVTFRDPKALEIALLLSGATIVDQIVNITAAEDYIYIPVTEQQLVINDATSTSPARAADFEHPTEAANASPNRHVYVSKAHGVITSVIARSSAMRQDAMNKAKAFDEKHQLRANASSRISSFDKRVGLSEKINNGVSVVNEKVKSVDQRLQVSDKTMAALLAAERKLNDTGSAVKTNRYVSAGTSWLNGAFSKVAKAGHVAGSRTREKFQIAVSNLTAKGPAVVA